MDMNYKELIDYITKEVIKRLESKSTNISDNRKKILVLGDVEKISLHFNVAKEYECLDINSYDLDGDVDKYSFVIISELTNARLCDIALARDDTPFTNAVLKALLRNKKVYLTESALVFRKYKDTSSGELYSMLEGYVQRLVKFGIIIKEEMDITDNYSSNKDRSNEDDNIKYTTTKRVITNNLAIDICKDKGNEAVFQKGTIITPLAKDVFFSAKKEIVFR